MAEYQLTPEEQRTVNECRAASAAAHERLAEEWSKLTDDEKRQRLKEAAAFERKMASSLPTIDDENEETT